VRANGARSDAHGELAKDTAHDIGFAFIDLAVAADRLTGCQTRSLKPN
jgi:hypothetical protein